MLDHDGLTYTVERKQVRKHGEERIFTHIHLTDRFPFELTIYAADKAHYVFKSSITGKAIERASIAELEQFLSASIRTSMWRPRSPTAAAQIDRFQLYESLLLPLENVKQPLQVSSRGRRAVPQPASVRPRARTSWPYDEEFLAAALLHDVGKAIDPADHVAAGLEALDGFITERTAWLIEHHMLAHQLADGTLGARARRRLRNRSTSTTWCCWANATAPAASRASKRRSWTKRSTTCARLTTMFQLTRPIAFHLQQPPLHGEALRRGEAAEESARGQHAVAGHDERVAILGHHLADGAGRTRRTAVGRQLAVAPRLAARNPSAGLHDAAAEVRQMALVDSHVAKIDFFARRIAP